MKLFYVPNEAIEGDQLGPHTVFKRMVAQGELSDYQAYPLNLRIEQLGLETAQAQILAQIQQQQPDLIVISKFTVPHQVKGMVKAWRQAAPGSFIAYHDGDPYGLLLVRLPGSAKDVIREVDAVFTVGLGQQRELFQFLGARRVEYTPSWTDTIRFGHDTSTTKECDVVLFGRYSQIRRLKIPFPGAAQRLQLVRLLQKEYGEGMRVYGGGYPEDVKTFGVVPYAEQERENRKARVTVSWNHFPKTPYYYSDRLPIALISGMPHVTNAFPGHAQVFADCPGVYFAQTPAEAQRIIKELLQKSDAELAAEGEGARQWVFKNLTADVVMPRVIRRMIQLRSA